MLAIFFPHLFEELEYLLPSDSEQPDTAAEATANVEVAPRTHAVHENAEAGPSTVR